MEWCERFKTERFAIGFLRHDRAINCNNLSREEGGSKEDTHCTVVENYQSYEQ